MAFTGVMKWWWTNIYAIWKKKMKIVNGNINKKAGMSSIDLWPGWNSKMFIVLKPVDLYKTKISLDWNGLFNNNLKKILSPKRVFLTRNWDN